MAMIIEPRDGDCEDDASSPKKRSLMAIAGSLLGEISPIKLGLAFVMLVLLPGLLLGAAPLLLTAWLARIVGDVSDFVGLWSLILLLGIVAVGWFGGRPLLRMAERSFWSLNALLVQPGFALWREGLRQLSERFLTAEASEDKRAFLRGAGAIAAGLIVSALAVAILSLVWPATRWAGTVGDLLQPLHFVLPALANALAILMAYLAIASLAWGLADGLMDQPRDLARFDDVPAPAPRWRVAHLSDIHIVGERYGFRIECGRAGPRGNVRLALVLARLAEIHAARPLDLLLITGDMTDAGRSAEWAEFLDAMALHPALRERCLIIPGNHDLNIVDRANPARLDLPMSPNKRLRQMRALAVTAAIQGDRVQVLDESRTKLAGSLSAALAPHREKIAAFADTGGMRLSAGLSTVWADSFPMVVPPAGAEGLGVILLNSNAEAHFSFTNALGMVPEEDLQAMLAIIGQYPKARWIIALHHHPVEYPRPVKAFSQRIGTALINGSRFLRLVKPLAHRLVAMHGHRHIDWIGHCGGLKIVSAPSPVMLATDRDPTCFYVHTLAAAADGGLALLTPERIEMTPPSSAEQASVTGLA